MSDLYWYFLDLRIPKVRVSICTRSGLSYVGDITEVSDFYVHLRDVDIFGNETRSAVRLGDIEAVVQKTQHPEKQNVLAYTDSIGSSGYV